MLCTKQSQHKTKALEPKNYYSTLNFEVPEEGICRATIQLDPQHPIFAGHFPDMPVLPGVCMVKMVRETLERRYAQPMRMASARSVKLLNVLDPNKNPYLRLVLNTLDMSDGSIGIDGILEDISEGAIFFKITAIYIRDAQ